MDALTHSLAGACIAGTGAARGLDRRTALTVALIAANAPDLDLLPRLVGGTDALVRWGLGPTHSAIALVLGPLIIALGAALVNRRGHRVAWRAVARLALLCWAAHLALDLASGGIRLLWPFLPERVGVDWLYPVDIVLWILLAVPLWLPRLVGAADAPIRLIALSLAGAWVGLCGVLHGVAVGRVADAALRRGIVSPTRVRAYPEPFLPLLWNGVVGDGRYLYQGRANLLGETRLGRVRSTNLQHPLVQQVLSGPIATRWYEEVADTPFVEVRCKADRRWVVIGDLARESPWLDRAGPRLVWEGRFDDRAQTFHVGAHWWRTPWGGREIPESDCAALRGKAWVPGAPPADAPPPNAAPAP